MTSRISRRELLDSGTFIRQVLDCKSPIPLFKEAYQHGRDVLHEFHLNGGAAASLVEHNAWLVDQLLDAAWQLINRDNPVQKDAALIAVGGYGRQELHPYSDIDLLILFNRAPNESSKAFAEHLVRFLWDIGLEVGHSVRTVKDCVSEARQDLTIITNLMEARHLIGDESLIEALRTRMAPNRIWPVRRYLEQKWQEQQQRYSRFEDTAYNLEPHIKEGPGGLRDIQMILWVTQRYFSAGGFRELVGHGFLREDEYRALIRGRNFLWRLRNALHFLAGRREDRLLFDYQREIASQFGLEDQPGSLAIEQLMKRYYRTVKELHLMNEILLQHFQEAVITRGRSKVTKISRRFRSVDGYLEATSEKVFEHFPFALIEVFLILQQNPELKGIRAETIRAIRANLHRINAEFRRDLRCRSLFAEIFRHSTGLTHTLRKMNNYGVLGAYLPEFGRVVGQMQHDLFHVYTVDAHLLFVIRNLRRFAVEKHHHEFPLASDIITNMFKPFRLYLSGLLHDIAKGRGGDHSVLGEKDALKICKRHDLSDYDAHFVAWLVRHHLLMSWYAQKQDITDPEVISRFAAEVGDQEHLDNLYLLTIADIRATSPHVWNSWKGQLLNNLYMATRRALRLGLGEPIDLARHVKEIKQEVLNSVIHTPLIQKSATDLWSLFEDDYFVRNEPDTIAWHAEAIINHRASDIPLVDVRFQNNLDAMQFFVMAPASSDLFANTAGAFERMRLNIVDAKLHRLRSGMMLLQFVVLSDRGTETRGAALPLLAKDLRKQILSPDPTRKSGKRLHRALKHFHIDTQITITDHPSGNYSTMELVTVDRPGLLHVVAKGLIDCKVELVSARVSTFGEKVEDIFMITDRDGNPLKDNEQISCIDERISSLLAENS